MLSFEQITHLLSEKLKEIQKQYVKKAQQPINTYTVIRQTQVGRKYLEATIQQLLIDDSIKTQKQLKQEKQYLVLNLSKTLSASDVNIKRMVYQLHKNLDHQNIKNLKTLIGSDIKEIKNNTSLFSTDNSSILQSLGIKSQDSSHQISQTQFNTILQKPSSYYQSDSSQIFQQQSEVEKYLSDLGSSRTQLNLFAQHFYFQPNFTTIESQHPNKFMRKCSIIIQPQNYYKFDKKEYTSTGIGSKIKDAQNQASKKILLEIYSSNTGVWQEIKSKKQKKGIRT